MKYYKLINLSNGFELYPYFYILNKVYKENEVSPGGYSTMGSLSQVYPYNVIEAPEYQYYAQLPEQREYFKKGDICIVIKSDDINRVGDIITIDEDNDFSPYIIKSDGKRSAVSSSNIRLYNQENTESKQIKTSKEMEEFSISGSVGLKKAFAEELGFATCSTSTFNEWNYLKYDDKNKFQGTNYRHNAYFNLPKDWNRAKDYVIAYRESLIPKVPTFQMCGYTSEIKKGEVVFGCKHISKDELNTVLKAAEICRKLEYNSRIGANGIQVGESILSVANLEKINSLI